MPGGAGMPESTFKAFDSQSFGRFQRKNKKVTEFLLEGKSNPRYELMMKMVGIKMQLEKMNHLALLAQKMLHSNMLQVYNEIVYMSATFFKY